ncbi:hypothetical protein ASPVEDRAFT_86471 [Aspergillus versicolor CBS 583.65]|uniref:Uncharacterized protein n=1 Tax=Aspergillus versicolor CBS 583.65 TaxID=1036611 RepID=A0A1L9PUL1_ASPVE|nr:uncharacterized protein ASPVEDRAFT_86471 [Aspergillus versicolor CBS 583.65]OJJ05106.1 hypothetical protein ASPVEDRAFT_86471 [Aspergillus versicolor CBS 583.65]
MSQQASHCAICFLLRHVANCDASGDAYSRHSWESGMPGQMRGDAEGTYGQNYRGSVSDTDGEDSVMGEEDVADVQVNPMRDREDDTVMSDSDDNESVEQGVFQRSDIMEIDDASWELLGGVSLVYADDSMVIDNGSDQLRKSEIVRRFSVELQAAVAI